MDKHAEARLDATRHGRPELAEPRLPRYSRASFSSVQSVELFEQTYTLQDSKGRAIIWMHVKSRAKEKKSWPLFCERDTIHGTIEVDFDLIDGAKAVSIAVRASSRFCFITLPSYCRSLTLWHDGSVARLVDWRRDSHRAGGASVLDC